MKTKYFNRYSFSELFAAATAPGAAQEDIDTLGAWCAEYGDCFNGEVYDASLPSEPSGTHQLVPIYRETEPDSDCWEVDRYEWR